MSTVVPPAVERIYNAFARKDFPAIVAAVTDDVLWVFPGVLPFSGTWRGKDDLRRYFGILASVARFEHHEVTRRIVDGDTVVCFGSHRARCLATDKVWQSPMIHVWTVRDGLVASMNEFEDTALAAAAFAP